MATSSENRDDLASNHLIKEGDQIILKKGKKLKIFKIKKDRPVWLEKNKFVLNGCVGYPYGSKFEVRGGRMVKMNKNKSGADSSQDGEALTGKDNRDLHDLDSNQKLTKDDIEKMKKEGFEGKEIIDQLIENSTTFQSKTEYAQEKWIKKKKQKHLLEFTVLKPCTRLLCEMYHFNSPAKICFMRMDTIAQMMSLGNVRANSTVAVVDTCMGLVVGAVMERLGGFGKVIHFYQGSTPIRPAVDNFDFPQTFLDNLYSYPLDQVNCIKTSKLPCNSEEQGTLPSSNSNPEMADNCKEMKVDKEETEEKTEKMESKTEEMEVKTEEMEVKTEKMEENSDKNDSTSQKDEHKEDITDAFPQDVEEKRISEKRKEKEMMRQTYKEAQQSKLQEIKDCLLQYNVDCLIVACKFHPTPIVLALVDYLAPSRPVVVFSQYKEPVMDSYVYLRERGGIVNFRLTESWLREYQVMEMRTHPVISMSGGGGYILTATTIAK